VQSFSRDVLGPQLKTEESAFLGAFVGAGSVQGAHPVIPQPKAERLSSHVDSYGQDTFGGRYVVYATHFRFAQPERRI